MAPRCKLLFVSIACLLLAGGCGDASSPAAAPAKGAAAKTPLEQLKAGNERYAAGRSLHPRQDPQQRTEAAKGQRPVAIIVGCADLRVPPELVFDQGLGDLFVVRVAGNVVDDQALGASNMPWII